MFVILVDTLRADRLGAYGGTHRRTPFIDTLAARSTVFLHAYAQSSWTAPSVASLFTSRFQSQHGVVSFASKLDEAEVTMAEVMHDRGYGTAAFLANGGIPESLGYGQGFDLYKTFWTGASENALPGKARGEQIGTEALRWLDAVTPQERPPVFMYLHYLEPHPPYTPPQAMLDRVSAGGPPLDPASASAHMFFATLVPPDAAAVRSIQQVYDAEVLSIDETLRHTFAALAARRLLDDAVVVFTADHGEEFLDHGGVGHGGSLYNEVIHVPLLIALPGQTARLDVPDVVSLIDVAPTLADLAGAPEPPSFEGRSLRPLFPQPPLPWWRRLITGRENAAPPRAAVSELLVRGGSTSPAQHQRALILEQRKVIVGPDGKQERYDLAKDPGESVQLESDDAPLEAALQAFVGRVPVPEAGPVPTLPPEQRERLKALGYVQ